MALIRKDVKKKRTAIFVRPDQQQQLEALSALHGTPMAESIRRAIDDYCEAHKEEIKQGLRLLKQ